MRVCARKRGGGGGYPGTHVVGNGHAHAQRASVDLLAKKRKRPQTTACNAERHTRTAHARKRYLGSGGSRTDPAHHRTSARSATSRYARLPPAPPGEGPCGAGDARIALPASSCLGRGATTGADRQRAVDDVREVQVVAELRGLQQRDVQLCAPVAVGKERRWGGGGLRCTVRCKRRS